MDIWCFKVLLFMVSEVYLDFIDFLQDLFRIAAVLVPHDFHVFAVVGFVHDLVLFEVCEFNVDLRYADFKVDPNGDEPDDEAAQADQLRYGHACNVCLGVHGFCSL